MSVFSIVPYVVVSANILYLICDWREASGENFNSNAKTGLTQGRKAGAADNPARQRRPVLSDTVNPDAGLPSVPGKRTVPVQISQTCLASTVLTPDIHLTPECARILAVPGEDIRAVESILRNALDKRISRESGAVKLKNDEKGDQWLEISSKMEDTEAEGLKADLRAILGDKTDDFFQLLTHELFFSNMDGVYKLYHVEDGGETVHQTVEFERAGTMISEGVPEELSAAFNARFPYWKNK